MHSTLFPPPPRASPLPTTRRCCSRAIDVHDVYANNLIAMHINNCHRAMFAAFSLFPQGLPPDDEAVLLARQAAAAGRTLMDVVGFSWAASAGEACAYLSG